MKTRETKGIAECTKLKLTPPHSPNATKEMSSETQEMPLATVELQKVYACYQYPEKTQIRRRRRETQRENPKTQKPKNPETQKPTRNAIALNPNRDHLKQPMPRSMPFLTCISIWPASCSTSRLRLSPSHLCLHINTLLSGIRHGSVVDGRK